ncbi:CLUMA_CG007824, isoform A [Clunio marinus]|uniref:CLUMA_CG007824, isoform A n=1 Tax=Clunio marinus TaxID=568069 RepID=A0A1J1I1Z3_9DIPT|nr:CLUMA_CG007824, isoform A [Clunio marinus]
MNKIPQILCLQFFIFNLKKSTLLIPLPSKKTRRVMQAAILQKNQIQRNSIFPLDFQSAHGSEVSTKWIEI